jgi:hypothetical protein
MGGKNSSRKTPRSARNRQKRVDPSISEDFDEEKGM